MIELLDTGRLFRNPKPYLRAANAWHPTLVNLGGGRLLASFDIGQAVESLDYRTYLAQSADNGQTWSEPERIFEEHIAYPASHTLRLTRLSDGSLAAFGGRFHRDRTEEGLTNRRNMGFVPMDLILLRSDDEGRTWTPPRTIAPPLVGPAFEICHSVVELRDGTWLWPTSTWRGWDGECPNGMKAVALASRDRGQTWPEYVDVMDDDANGVIHLEQSLVELPDGRLLAVAWAFDEKSGTSREVRYAISRDRRTFSPAQSTGLHGETSKLVHLSDDALLCVYRRTDQPGLWAARVRVDADGQWTTLEQQPIWQGAATKMHGQRGASDELGDLRAGYPSLCKLDDGNLLAAFWCCEENVFNIRWALIRC
jgi:hypothetical protein